MTSPLGWWIIAVGREMPAVIKLDEDETLTKWQYCRTCIQPLMHYHDCGQCHVRKNCGNCTTNRNSSECKKCFSDRVRAKT